MLAAFGEADAEGCVSTSQLRVIGTVFQGCNFIFSSTIAEPISGWVRTLLDPDGDGIFKGIPDVVANPGRLDSDQDGFSDLIDNCPLILNSDQADVDNDGLGDVCS